MISGTLLFYFSKRIKYTPLLYATSFIALLIPFTLMISSNPAMLGAYFFIGGVMYTFYKIAIEGVLLEISDHKNRTIYIGMVGAGNILPAIFPIFGGWLIPNYGFNYFFLLFSIIILFSIYFIIMNKKYIKNRLTLHTRLKCFKTHNRQIFKRE